MLPAQQGPGKRRLEEGDMATLSPAVVVGWEGMQWGSAAAGLGDRQRQVEVGRETAVVFSAHIWFPE